MKGEAADPMLARVAEVFMRRRSRRQEIHVDAGASVAQEVFPQHQIRRYVGRQIDDSTVTGSAMEASQSAEEMAGQRQDGRCVEQTSY